MPVPLERPAPLDVPLPRDPAADDCYWSVTGDAGNGVPEEYAALLAPQIVVLVTR